MRHITLTETETDQLEHLYKNCPNSVLRQRSLCILLSSQGYSMLDVSIMLGIHRHTVRRLANKWDRASDEDKLLVLYTAKGQGAKLKLESVAELLPSLVEIHRAVYLYHLERSGMCHFYHYKKDASKDTKAS